MRELGFAGMNKAEQDQTQISAWAKTGAGLLPLILVLIIAFLIGWFFPTIKSLIVSFIEARSPDLATWLRNVDLLPKESARSHFKVAQVNSLGRTELAQRPRSDVV